ncbi:unnamed protein product [Closterium sp. Yama58-4]|nr:unnamed protein product [Closterium sp. Yama58-4]
MITRELGSSEHLWARAIERLQVKQARVERAAAKKAAKAAKAGKGSKAGAAGTSTEAGKGSGKESGKASKAANECKGSKAGAAETSTKDQKTAGKDAKEGTGKDEKGEEGKRRSKASKEVMGETKLQEEVGEETMGADAAGKGEKKVRVKRGKKEEEVSVEGRKRVSKASGEVKGETMLQEELEGEGMGAGEAGKGEKAVRATKSKEEESFFEAPQKQVEVKGGGMGAGEVGNGGKAVRVRKSKKEEGEEMREVAGEASIVEGEESGQEVIKVKRPRKQESKAVGRSMVKTVLEAGEEGGKEGKAAGEGGEGDQERGDTRRGEKAKGETAQEHEQLSIFEATRLVWNYVKAHNLKTGKHTAAFDDKLRALFGVDGANSSRVPGLLLPHMQEVREAGKEASQVGGEAAQLGKEASKVGTEAAQVGKEAAQVGKEASQVVGKEAAVSGKRSKDVKGNRGAMELARLKQLPRRPSEQLKEIIGKEHERLSILEATSLVWSYVKANSLQAGPNTAAFDDKLRALFGVDSAHFFGLPKLLSQHMEIVDSEGDRSQQEDAGHDSAGIGGAAATKAGRAAGAGAGAVGAAGSAGAAGAAGVGRAAKQKGATVKAVARGGGNEAGISSGKEESGAKQPSPMLKEFLGFENDSITLKEAGQQVWQRIKEQGKKVEVGGGRLARFRVDGELQQLLGVEEVTSLGLYNLLKKHLK